MWVSWVCLFLLSYPQTDYVVHGIKQNIVFSFGINVAGFIGLVFVLGFFMSLGKAAVYKHIPVYYPGHVGSVGGVVGMIGGLGGFVLPIAFGAMNDITGVWTSCFMLLFLLVATALTWMHFAILRMEKKQTPALAGPALELLDRLPPTPERGAYELALQISMNLKRRLEDAGVKVVMTRTTNDVRLSNAARARVANRANADLSNRQRCKQKEGGDLFLFTIFSCRSDAPENQDEPKN